MRPDGRRTARDLTMRDLRIRDLRTDVLTWVRVRRVAAFGVAALAATFVFATAPGQAQGTVKSVHGDWQVRCDTPPGAQAEQCALMQSVTAEDRKSVV